MENNNCPICGQNNTEIIFTKGNLDKDLINVICKNCTLVYINPRPSKAEYYEFHREEFLNQKNKKEFKDIEKKLESKDIELKRTIYSFLKEYIRPGMNILDIGCGFGSLLNILKEEAHVNVYGVELGNLDVLVAKKRFNLDIFHGSLEDFTSNLENHHKFDLIITHHTFEHLPKPLESLDQIKKLLKIDGVLYIGVPNIMNIKKRPDILFQIAHPFTYSPYSLKLILEYLGFGIVKYNKNAGYPGGMEVVVKFGEESIKNSDLNSGKEYEYVINYVKKTDDSFGKMRRTRDRTFFFLPKHIRVNLGRFIYKYLKYRK